MNGARCTVDRSGQKRKGPAGAGNRRLVERESQAGAAVRSRVERRRRHAPGKGLPRPPGTTCRRVGWERPRIRPPPGVNLLEVLDLQGERGNLGERAAAGVGEPARQVIDLRELLEHGLRGRAV